MIRAVGVVLIVVALLLGIGYPVVTYITTIMPANIQYNEQFGADIEMATQTSTTLVGPNSIQTYINNIQNNINVVFAGKDLSKIYLSPMPWNQKSSNTMVRQVQYLDSLNASLVTRQAQVDAAIARGVYMSTDPLQTAINQTRNEMNAYGGLDWILNNAYYLTFYPTVYWSGLYFIITWIIAFIIGCIGFIMMLTEY
jgi:hypothetical protein